MANGYWSTWERPEDGRGDLIPVRKRLILEGREVCRSYRYVGPDNCRVVSDLGHGTGQVASAASRYHPLYYWFPGTVAQMTDGADAVYAMRTTSGVLCSLFIGLAAWVLAANARTMWPLIAMCLALTPVLMYATAIPAPNGIEMLAGLMLWACVVALTTKPARVRTLLIMGAAAASVLATVRSLGPLWLALILLVSGVALGRELRPPLRAHPHFHCLPGGHRIGCDRLDLVDHNRWNL